MKALCVCKVVSINANNSHHELSERNKRRDEEGGEAFLISRPTNLGLEDIVLGSNVNKLSKL